MSKIPKQRSTEQTSGLLDLVHTNVSGPIEVASVDGARNFVIFIDDHFIWFFIYRIRLKSEPKERYLHYEKLAKRQTGRLVRMVRSDRGGE